MGRALGLDVGDKTVGMALSDELGITAQGMPTLARKNNEADLSAIAKICSEQGVERVVVGLPMNMDGTEGPRAELTRKFADKLAACTGLPIEMWDERLTTAEAQRVLIEADVSRQKRKKVIDKLAAQVILQGWLDAQAMRAQREED